MSIYGLLLVSLSILACNGASLPTGTDAKKTDSTTDFAICSIGDQQLKPGQRSVQGNFTFECQLGDGGIIRTAIVACLDEDKKEHPIGERWDTGKAPFRFVLECTKNGGVTTRRVAQCFYDSPDGQARLDPNQEKQVGRNLIKCESFGSGGLKYSINWGKPSDSPASPTNNANTVVNANTNGNAPSPTANTNTNTNTNSTVTSTNVPTVQRSEPIPSSSTNNLQATCNVGGKEVQVGSRGQSGSFVYECQRSGNLIMVTIVACLDDNKAEHPFGGQWMEGSAPFRYVYECTKTGEETRIRAIKCAYVAKDGHEVRIEFGKEETVDNLVVQCQQMGANGVQYHTSFSPAYVASLNANATIGKGQ